jgi:mono/diheme cytochrome c family protein
MRMALAASFVLAGVYGVHAAEDNSHGPADLNPVQAEGRQLFQQSCGVCHTKPTITAPLFGPELSKTAVEGSLEAKAKSQIADGSPNMPGFKYNYTPTQIASIVEYLKLLPPPPPAAPARATPTSAPANPAR